MGSIGFHVTEVVGHAFYQMWYGSDNGTVEYAVSNNGTEWEQSGMSPLFGLDAGEWDADAFTNQVGVGPIDMQYVMSYQGYSLGQRVRLLMIRGVLASPPLQMASIGPNTPTIP